MKRKLIKIGDTIFEEKTNFKTITKNELSDIKKFNTFLKPDFLENFELKELVGYGSESYVYRAQIKRNKTACVPISRDTSK